MVKALEALSTYIIRARSDRVSAMQLNSFWACLCSAEYQFFYVVCFHMHTVYSWTDADVQLL